MDHPLEVVDDLPGFLVQAKGRMGHQQLFPLTCALRGHAVGEGVVSLVHHDLHRSCTGQKVFLGQVADHLLGNPQVHQMVPDLLVTGLHSRGPFHGIAVEDSITHHQPQGQNTGKSFHQQAVLHPDRGGLNGIPCLLQLGG